jgi:hypothetical protein
MRNQTNQGELFAEEAWRKTFQVIPKLPYSFSYRFTDADGRESELQVLDWEAGALFWNCRHRHGDENTALQKVKAKYLARPRLRPARCKVSRSRWKQRRLRKAASLWRDREMVKGVGNSPAQREQAGLWIFHSRVNLQVA